MTPAGDIVLLGAGHAHLAALRHWRSDRRPVVVSRAATEHYSGLVPAVLRGEAAQATMRLDRAAEAAGGRLIVGHCERIDTARRTLVLADGRAVPFELLSLDLGARSAAPPGAVAVRPAFGLQGAIEAIEEGGEGPVAVVGAGAAGTELALALALRWAGQRAVLLIAPDVPLPRAPTPIRRRARDALSRAGVTLVAGRAGQPQAQSVPLDDGRVVEAVAVLWTAGLVAPPLAAASGLACDAAGFVLVDAALRSVSHPFVFAAGDCASLGAAKSGAVAVASGRALARGLARVAEGRAPSPWPRPRHALAIIGIGHRRGLAWRGETFWLAGAPAWWLKSALDRHWMRKLR